MEKQIVELSDRINLLIAASEVNLEDLTAKEFVEAIYSAPIDFSSLDEELSEELYRKVTLLLNNGIAPGDVSRLLRESARPQFATLSVIKNEIASKIVGRKEIHLPSEIVKKVKRLDDEGFKLLSTTVGARYPNKESISLILDCRFDRWALVVDEDRFDDLASTFMTENGLDS